VVGGGAIGSRKVENLLRAGAIVTLVSPEVAPELASAVEAGRIEWINRPFSPEDLKGAFLVVATTDDADLNGRIVELAGEAGILYCDASSSERSQVIFGALHRDAGTTVAVFTDGKDPSTARKTRDRIAESMLGGRVQSAERRTQDAE
jgi:siroheme synthase-like protein